MLARIKPQGSVLRALTRYYSEATSGQSQGSSNTGPPSPPTVDVPGLSSSCIEPASEPVGPSVDPNKSGPYKSPEYFQYNDMTYFEAEVEMQKYRIPQPSALKQPAS